jgi:hypothetical protein
VFAGQDIFDHELVAVLDKPEIRAKAPTLRPPRQGRSSPRCGIRLRPCGVGTGIRWSPVRIVR